ncbi:hypothetical protein LPJ70_002205 [Coemansia sp. RSA 2708]|nr:hypothetical protein LPJ70_002205 [Coemansia sp. RSA 2708]KAJ2314058.1 hypothetical protein IWW54_001149 [Coemansia sp. RSA 2705]
MTSRLPPELLRLFTPRPPLTYVEPVNCPPEQRPAPKISGIASYVSELASAPAGKPNETSQQRKERLKAERAQQARDKIVRGMSSWDPSLNLQATEDPYKTIIVARLNYDASEKDLRSEFEAFGEIVSVKMVKDTEGNFRGYAFIEYAHESDMREAYRCADGIRILGRRVVVDVERGRTVKGWAPRRFGGGLGGTRIGSKEQNQRDPGRYDPAAPPSSGGRRYGDHGRERSSRPRSYDRSQSHGRSSHRSGGYLDSRSRGRDRDYDRNYYDRDRDRDRGRDRSDRRSYRHRSRSPSSRPSRRDRSNDRNGTSGSHYSRRH